MRELLTLMIVAAITAAAWTERARIVATLEDEWAAFLSELEVTP
jgi:hypothetical protein